LKKKSVAKRLTDWRLKGDFVSGVKRILRIAINSQMADGYNKAAKKLIRSLIGISLLTLVTLGGVLETFLVRI
jgi:hypothetical protein